MRRPRRSATTASRCGMKSVLCSDGSRCRNGPSCLTRSARTPDGHVPTELLRQGRLEEARVAWQTALEGNPLDHNAWFGYAELCLFLGREDEYRRARRDLLARFFITTNPYFAERTGRACLLMPATGDELRQAAALTRRAAASDPSAHGGDYSWFLFARGLAEYREGKFDQAISTMRGDASRVGGPITRLVLAMALHQDGQLAEAWKTLAAAILSYDWKATQARDHDAWICHVLRREAEGLSPVVDSASINRSFFALHAAVDLLAEWDQTMITDAIGPGRRLSYDFRQVDGIRRIKVEVTLESGSL